jgi:inward rectifier potassium channel
MIKKISKKFKADNDTGFASQATYQGGRMLNTDGSYNVVRKGLPFFIRFSFFHELIMMKWAKFWLAVMIFYVGMNVLFGTIYYFIGVEHLNGTIGNSEKEKFLESFFFSTQTFATVGYGRINPTGVLTNTVASLEALMGVMSLALVTSLLYSRFSRPQAKMKYSENMIVAPYQGSTALMFRIANAGKDQLIECEAQLMISFVVNENNANVRKFLALKLERDKIASMPLSWTIVHPLDEDSPIQHFTLQDLADSEAEFIFMFKAFDDTYSQGIHSRTSYKTHEIVWGAKFKPMFHRTDDNSGTILEFDQINEFDRIELPLRLQKAASQ